MALIVPNVYADMTQEKFKGNVKILPLSSDIGNIPEFADKGETITFPMWKNLAETTEDLTEVGTELTPVQLSQESSTATVKFEGKTIRCFDYNNATAMGSAIEESARQHGEIFARKLDTDLIAEAKTTELYEACAGANALTELELQSALISSFSDDIDADSFAGIIINPILVPSFYTSASFPSFTSAIDTTVTAQNGIVRNQGLIGLWRGIPVYTSSRGTYDSTASECETLIVKKNALGYKLKRNIAIETERLAKLQATDITATMFYACKLIKAEGVCVVKKTIA